MPIEKECEPYLKSTEVVSILQSSNETFKSRVLNCINRHKALVCNNIIHNHPIIESEILKMCCEIAFQDAQIIFVRKVENNTFSPDQETCIPYLKGIFRKVYLGEYRRELKRKITMKNMERPSSGYDAKDPLTRIQENVAATLLTLGETDQKIYRLRYEEGMKLKDIAILLHLQYQTVRAKCCDFHKRFGDQWKFNQTD